MSQHIQEEVLKKEEEILKTEQAILKTEKRLVTLAYVGLGTVFALAILGLYLVYASGHVSIEKSVIAAPQIDLGASSPGILQEVDVHEGDIVSADAVVARVDNQPIRTKVGGLVIAVHKDIGKRFNPGEPIVSLIDPRELRVVGSVAEDKGLRDLRIGQAATFTVDAFGSRVFDGVVDEISPTSRQSGIVFNISDKRETKEFDVKVRFDIDRYPELKNGMSAKLTVLKD